MHDYVMKSDRKLAIGSLIRGCTGPFAFNHSFQPPCKTLTRVKPLA